MNARAPHRDAIRILFILNAGGVPLTDPNDALVAKIFKGEARLHAFDFWMRNPDYLASELLDAYGETGRNHVASGWSVWQEWKFHGSGESFACHLLVSEICLQFSDISSC